MSSAGFPAPPIRIQRKTPGKRAAACGAITGGLVVLGLFGIDNPAEYYARLRANHEGMLDCADLLRRNKELGREKKPHCDALVFECVTLVEQLLREQGKLEGGL